MVNNPHRRVSNLVIGEELVELSEVGIRLKDIQQVQSQIDGLFVVVPKRARYGAEERLVVKHDLHILVRKAQIEQRHGSFGLGVSRLVVEHLEVVVDLVDVNRREVNLRTLLLCMSKSENNQYLEDQSFRNIRILIDAKVVLLTFLLSCAILLLLCSSSVVFVCV